MTRKPVRPTQLLFRSCLCGVAQRDSVFSVVRSFARQFLALTFLSGLRFSDSAVIGEPVCAFADNLLPRLQTLNNLHAIAFTNSCFDRGLMRLAIAARNHH